MKCRFLKRCEESSQRPRLFFMRDCLDETSYLLTGGIVGIIIAHLLFKKKSGGEILSVLYFGYFFIETLVTTLSLGFGFLISPLFTMGLVISIVLLVAREMK